MAAGDRSIQVYNVTVSPFTEQRNPDGSLKSKGNVRFDYTVSIEIAPGDVEKRGGQGSFWFAERSLSKTSTLGQLYAACIAEIKAMETKLAGATATAI